MDTVEAVAMPRSEPPNLGPLRPSLGGAFPYALRDRSREGRCRSMKSEDFQSLLTEEDSSEGSSWDDLSDSNIVD
jgi:hypothetical protein